jgi:hypothetical protein
LRIVIIQLMLSLYLGPKVIAFSGFRCNTVYWSNKLGLLNMIQWTGNLFWTKGSWQHSPNDNSIKMHYILILLIKSYLGLAQPDQINWMLTLSVITLGGFHCSIIWLIKLSEIITLLRISLNLVNYYTKWLQHFYLFCIIISIIWNNLKNGATKCSSKKQFNYNIW